ncbi:MAG: hypothetical protein A3H28_11425 [Acidobacteria bacterium RIFCSPLOWO2_02_FULL_61_28]|nr:MAG: hypothetical protein A3H28_11425 [Acidobacteria bacterium RIFCSPLOWO2_02_FULL_61_28]
MKTVNLNKESPSVGELLTMARKKSVLLVSRDGASFVLEEADEFDREVAELGNSARFMRFLQKRSKEKGVTSIEQFAEKFTEKTHNTAAQRTHVAPKHLRAPSAREKRSPRRG